MFRSGGDPNRRGAGPAGLMGKPRDAMHARAC